MWPFRYLDAKIIDFGGYRQTWGCEGFRQFASRTGYCVIVLLCYCVTVLRCHRVTVLNCVPLLLCYRNTVLLRYCVTVLLCSCVTMLLCYCAAVGPIYIMIIM